MSENLNGVENITSTNHQVTNKKRKWKFIIGGLLVLIAIGVGLLFGYQKLNSDPVSIYKNAINATYNLLRDSIKEVEENSLDIDITKEPVNLNLDVKLDSSMEQLKNFTGLNYNLNLGLDYSNKKINVGAGIKDKNVSIVSALVSIINSDIYLKSDELINKVVKAGEYDIFSELDLESYLKVNGETVAINYDNLEYILKEMKGIIIESLDKDKFTIKEETLNINNKDFEVKNVAYNLDKENMKRTMKFITDHILQDEKLIKAIAETVGITTTELKDTLKEEIDYSNYADIQIVLYTNKLNNIIAGSIIEANAEIIKFYNINDLFKIVIELDDDKIKVEEYEEYTEVKFYESNSEIISLNIKENNDDLKIDYKMVIEGSTYSGTLESSNIQIKDNKISGDFKFSINTNVLGNTINIALDGNYSLEKGTVTTIDPTNSIKLEELSQEELMDVYTKLSSILERFGLTELLTSM